MPSVMVVGAIALATVSDRIDANIDTLFLANIPWLYQNQLSGARAVLSAIAKSMIGVAAVSFSMTIVKVSFAASNTGPRLIGNVPPREKEIEYYQQQQELAMAGLTQTNESPE